MNANMSKTLLVVAGLSMAARPALGDVTLPNTSTIAEIQAALDEAPEGSVITLPAGDYAISSQLKMTRVVILRGAGMDKTFLRASGKFNLMFLVNPGKEGAVVSDLTVCDAQSSANFSNAPTGVDLYDGTLERVRVTNCKGTHQNTTGSVRMRKATSLLKRCQIDGNSLTSNGTRGGGISMDNGRVENCQIFGNSAPNGGGVYIEGAGSCSILNCTIIKNSSTVEGGGIHFSDEAKNKTRVISDTIVYGNTTKGADADIHAGPEVVIIRCASVAGKGDSPVLGDPGFTDADANDLTLAAVSPCIDRGAGELVEDFAGTVRPLGLSSDVGCYEFDPDKPSCGIAADRRQVVLGSTVNLTGAVGGFASATDIVWKWTITSPDGTETVAETQNVAFKPAQYGAYDVSLRVSSEMLALTVRADKEDYLLLAPATNYVTSTKTGTPTPPYATPETAAHTLADALSAAVDGTTIICDAGTHEVNAALTIDKAVTVCGAGMADTSLYMTQEFAPAISINNAGATICDLTIEHARFGVHYNYNAIAVDIGGSGGTLRRCRVTDCTNNGKRGGVGIVRLNSNQGRITHCLIDGNVVNSSNSGGGAIDVIAGLVDNSVIVGNESGSFQNSESVNGGGGIRANGGRIVNCTIVGNTIHGAAGGGVCKSAGAILENCIVYGNKAPDDATDPQVTGAPNLGGSVENVSHCLVGQAVGTDPVLGEPAFMDAPNGDFRLAPSSPCRDIAEVDRYLELLGLDTIEGETDFDEMPRLSGAKIDVGAHEYDASKVSCAFSVDKTVAFVPATFTLTPSVEGFTDPEGATLTWTFEPVHGGEPIVVVQTGTNALCQVLSSNEQYRVSLAGAGAGQSGSFTRADPIYAAARTNYVTAAENPNCCFPYGTPETAATNLADAVDASVDDAMVFVGEGTNVVRATILLEKKITVKGIARDRAWLRAPTAYGPLIRLNHAGAVVADLTIANGQAIDNWKSAGSAAAVDFDVKGGTLSGCRVTECGLDRKNVNANMGSEVAALFLHSDKAVVTRCVVDNFDGIGYWAGSGGGFHCGGCGVIATAGRIDNSIISNVVGVTKDDFLGLALNIRGTAVALNCTVVSNSEYLAGGGVGVHALSTVQNTVSVDNFNSVGVESNIGGEEKCVCCLSPSFTSTANGNVIGRPVYREGSLVQKADSPGRNKGSVAGYEDILFDGTDFYGKRRVKSPRRSAKAKIDIGCAESDPDGLTVLVK